MPFWFALFTVKGTVRRRATERTGGNFSSKKRTVEERRGRKYDGKD